MVKPIRSGLPSPPQPLENSGSCHFIAFKPLMVREQILKTIKQLNNQKFYIDQ